MYSPRHTTVQSWLRNVMMLQWPESCTVGRFLLSFVPLFTMMYLIFGKESGLFSVLVGAFVYLQFAKLLMWLPSHLWNLLVTPQVEIRSLTSFLTLGLHSGPLEASSMLCQSTRDILNPFEKSDWNVPAGSYFSATLRINSTLELP